MDGLAEKSDRKRPCDRCRQAPGAFVRGSGTMVTDGPFAETKEVIGGFTLIKAADMTEAAALARGCPILARGGEVEVRPLD